MPWNWEGSGRKSVAIGGSVGTAAEAFQSKTWPSYQASYLAHALGASDVAQAIDKGGSKYASADSIVDEAKRTVYFDKVTKDYQEEADECLKKEFADWLQGKHNLNDAAIPYENRPGLPQRKFVFQGGPVRNAKGGGYGSGMPGEPLKDWRPTWWGRGGLTHLDGVRPFLREMAIKSNDADLELNILAEFGPQNIDQAWAYFKHWVKGRPISEATCLNPTIEDGGEDPGRIGPLPSDSFYKQLPKSTPAPPPPAPPPPAPTTVAESAPTTVAESAVSAPARSAVSAPARLPWQRAPVRVPPPTLGDVIPMGEAVEFYGDVPMGIQIKAIEDLEHRTEEILGEIEEAASTALPPSRPDSPTDADVEELRRPVYGPQYEHIKRRIAEVEADMNSVVPPTEDMNSAVNRTTDAAVRGFRRLVPGGYLGVTWQKISHIHARLRAARERVEAQNREAAEAEAVFWADRVNPYDAGIGVNDPSSSSDFQVLQPDFVVDEPESTPVNQPLRVVRRLPRDQQRKQRKR